MLVSNPRILNLSSTNSKYSASTLPFSQYFIKITLIKTALSSIGRFGIYHNILRCFFSHLSRDLDLYPRTYENIVQDGFEPTRILCRMDLKKKLFNLPWFHDTHGARLRSELCVLRVGERLRKNWLLRVVYIIDSMYRMSSILSGLHILHIYII